MKSKRKKILSLSISALLLAGSALSASAAGLGSDTIQILDGTSAEVSTEAEPQVSYLDRQAAVDAGSQGAITVNADEMVNAAEAGITAEDAVEAARTLLSQMRHYAEQGDEAPFRALYEGGADEALVTSQMDAVKASLDTVADLDSHSDVCIRDASDSNAEDPWNFTCALLDYKVRDDGTVTWYSTVLTLADFSDGFRLTTRDAAEDITALNATGFQDAAKAGRNAQDFYPYLGMRFSPYATFTGTFYSLLDTAWQNEDGSVSFTLWVANDGFGDKWLDQVRVILTDTKLGTVADSIVDVQRTLPVGTSAILELTIPADEVVTGSDAWTSVSAQTNLSYQ